MRTFASEVDPFELGVLDTGHLVLFRNVWRDGQRYVQGALVDRPAFVATALEAPYRASSVGGVARLTVAFQGRTLDTLAAGISEYRSAAGDLTGAVLHRARLSPPFGDIELTFLVDALPRAPGTALLAWVAVTLAVVLCGGFLLMYRFAVGQMRLARQQQDFVSAVSHELKTPLTSIRMYGEMLKAGWADEAKRQTYYDYIHSESERLSRLIENVLQLARLTRNSQRFDLKSMTVAELLDLVRSKVATQVERAGFALTVRNDAPDAAVVVDADCFAQIFINLVDNALKFSASAATRPSRSPRGVRATASCCHGARLRPGRAESADEEDLRALLSRGERTDARNRWDRDRTRARAATRGGDGRACRRAQLRAGGGVSARIPGRHAALTVSGGLARH